MSPFSAREPRELEVPGQVLERVTEAAKDGQLHCSAALRLADELRVPPLVIGEAANRLSVRIVSCQLGCFDS